MSSEGAHGTLKRIPGIQSEGHGLNLDQDMEKKYLALAAAVRFHDPLNRSAAYTSTSNSTKAPCSIRTPFPWNGEVEVVRSCNVEVTDVLHLSYRAITHLELLFGAQTASPRQSLFAVINHTHVPFPIASSADRRRQPTPPHLPPDALRRPRPFFHSFSRRQPSTPVSTSSTRCCVVATCSPTSALCLSHPSLTQHLARYGDINDVLFSLAVKLPEPSVRVAVRTVRSLLRLRHDLDLLVALAALLQPLRGSLAQALVAVFADPQWRQLATTLDAYLDVAKDM